MIEPAPPGATRGEALTAGWPTALIRGLLAFAVMALLGQAVAFAIYLISGAGSAVTFAKLGWFYFGWFHHVALVAELPNLSLGQGASQAIGGALPGGTSIAYHAGIALGLVTMLAGLLLFLAGRATAREAGGSPLVRALHGTKVAVAYAVPAFLISLAVSIDVRIPDNAFVSGRVQVHSSTWQSFVLPFVVAVVAGGFGGLSTVDEASRTAVRWVHRTLGAVAGGVRMFLLGLALAFLGLLVLAAVKPDATRAYFSGVSEPPADETTVVVGHHVLLLPNQSMWVLVPAMGSCDGAYGSGISVPFLCYWKFPQQVRASLISPQAGLEGLGSPVNARFDTAPWGYFVFLLVPLVSVLAGGWHGARHGGAATTSEGALLGGAAGVVFAVCVLAASWFASVSAGFDASVFGISTGGSIRVGPDLLSGGVLALLWGVIGGALAGWWVGRRLPAPPPEAAGFGPAPAGPGAGTTPVEPSLPPPPPAPAGAPTETSPWAVPPGESEGAVERTPLQEPERPEERTPLEEPEPERPEEG